jgi:hypothetical protein
MDRAQLKVLARVLDEAASEFSNHGCNDFDLSKQGLTPDEIESFKVGFTQYMKSENSEYEGPSGNYVQDDCVMRYLQKVVEEESKVSQRILSSV